MSDSDNDLRLTANDDSDADPDFVVQLTRFFNGPLEPGDLEAIQNRLTTDPSARRLFVQIAAIDGVMTEQAMQNKQPLSIATDLSEVESNDDPSSLSLDDATVRAAIRDEDVSEETDESLTLPDYSANANQSSPAPAPLLSASLIIKISTTAAVLLLTTFVAIWIARDLHPQTVAVAPISTTGVSPIHIGAMVRAEWDSSSPALKLDSSVPDVPLYLRSGWVRLDFPTGVTTVIEAPAKFQVQSGTEVKIELGRIAAQVPPAGHGFMVESPTCRVIDLGTDFGLSVVEQGQSEVQVFKGQVSFAKKIAPDVLEPAQLLAAGEGRRVDPNSDSVVATTANPTAFVRAEQFQRWTSPSSDGLNKWRSFNEQLSRDPSLMLLYTLDDSDRSAIHNHAATTVGHYDLPTNDAHDPTWVAGRMPGISALDFDASKQQCLLLPICPITQTGKMSGTVWINIRSFTPFGSIIKNWGTTKSGAFHLGLGSVTHNVEIELDGSKPGGPNLRDSATALARQWTHVAFVSDGTTVRLYRDGKEVASCPSRPIDGNPPMKCLSIGYKTGDDGSSPAPATSSGFWDGQIGEIALFNRVLSPDEIARMSELGRP